MRRWIPLVAALIAARASAQTSSFLTTLGKDTLSFEQYRRVGDTITGDWVTGYGGIMYHHYVIVLRPEGRVQRYSLSLHRASGKAEGAVDLSLTDDSLIVTTSGPPDSTRRIGASADAAVFASTIAALETITTLAHRRGGDSSVVRTVPAFGPYRLASVPVVFFGGDSARLGNPRAPLLLRVNGEGEIQSLSARLSTTRTETVRVPNYDLAALARHFHDVAEDAPILGAPSISPRDTARGTVGNATITIDYGRPSVRGRDVFSHGVLGDTIWRAGANAATQFTTMVDLSVGGKRLPAGTYSLWVHVRPNDSAYELLFNSQHGQWGTEHHPDRDVLAIPLDVRRMPAFVEQLRFDLERTGPGAILHLRWANLDLFESLAVWPAQH